MVRAGRLKAQHAICEPDTFPSENKLVLMPTLSMEYMTALFRLLLHEIGMWHLGDLRVGREFIPVIEEQGFAPAEIDKLGG
jgi:hypothetical protein